MTITSKQLQYLRVLHKCPKKLRKDLLEKLPTSSIKAICECCLNLLRGHIPLTNYQKNSLKKDKLILRRLADKKKPLYTKRKLIIQKGGFLNILLPAAITAITSLIHGIR